MIRNQLRGRACNGGRIADSLGLMKPAIHSNHVMHRESCPFAGLLLSLLRLLP